LTGLQRVRRKLSEQSTRCAKIQAARRRSDAELWQRFDILMEPPYATPEYSAFYRSTIEALGLDRHFRELREVTPSAR